MKKIGLVGIFMTVIFGITSGQVLAAGDVKKGRKVAKKCMACHTVQKDGKHRLGPNLYGILGQTAGQKNGYKYTSALKNSGLVWDAHTFNDFVTNPKKVIKRTKMSFRGIKKASQREDLIAYFRTLKEQAAGSNAPIIGNAQDGLQVVEKHCTVCHSFNKGGKVVFGPNLFGVAGKPAASVAGYRYSKAMKNSGLIWTDKNIIAFMSKPEQFVKGTTARFPGLKSAKDRANIVAYIKTLN